MDALGNQIASLFEKGLPREKIAEVLCVEPEVVASIVGWPSTAVSAATPEEDTALAKSVLREITANKRANTFARVNAAKLLLDEVNGRNDILKGAMELAGASQLNQILKGLKTSREDAYSALDHAINVTKT